MTANRDSPGFERGTGFLLARLGSLAARSWTSFLAEHQLSQMQYAVLVVLSEQGALGQLRLAQLVAVDARNLVAIIDALSARGLVTRERDATDGRRRNVHLTAAGEATVEALTMHARASRDDFLRSLDMQERRQLNELLQRVYNSHAEHHEHDDRDRTASKRE